MIAYIRGTLTEKDPTRVIIEAAGVGYEMIISLSTYESLPREGAEAKLLAYHCVREDDEILFGFATEQEREMFAKLTSVSGVGPKIAISILSGCSLSELALAISTSDAKRISSIKGVGKKTAEKICVELRDKVSALDAASLVRGESAPGAESAVLRDAVAALRALGFTDEVSSKMVTDVLAKDSSVDSVEKIVRLALKGK